MKKSLLLFCVIVVCCFLIYKPATSVSAQKESDRRGQPQGDRELASAIKDLTAATGLVERGQRDGSRMIALNGTFQNVMLSKLDEDGDTAVGCVASLGDANAFFGHNLETGEIIPGAPKVPKYFKDAARHGMSPREYQFYTDVIDNWAARRDQPESATMTIQNNDGLLEGFNDTTPVAAEGGNSGLTRAPQRLTLFQAAADVWDGFLDSPVTIQVRSEFNDLTCTPTSAVLGSAGAWSFRRNHAPGVAISNTWYPIALANKQAGFDIEATTPDIFAQFNSDIDTGCFGGADRWYYGLDTATPPDTLNLFAVLLHEMGHGLGFQTLIDSAGNEAGGDDIYATFAYDEDVITYWNQMTVLARNNSIRNTNDVLWDGSNVKIASGGLTAGRNPANGRVELYTPNPFEGGSSMSHFNVDCAPNLLMEPFLEDDVLIDLDLTKQHMRDIGWFRDTTVNNVADTITGVTRSATAVIGSNITISWTNNGSFARNVTIELSTDNGLTFPTAVATNIANTGSFVWNVPSMQTSTARLRVREHNFVAPMDTSSTFSILVTTAASVAVWGRVTDAAGAGVTRATVSLTDARGMTRTALTSSFGYFRFDDVASGETYVAAVRHKRFNFAPRVVNVVDEISGLDFTPSP